MKKNEVKVNSLYLAKVSDKVVPVRITGTSGHGGWDAVNEATGKKVRIKSAQRLRGPAEQPEAVDAKARHVVADAVPAAQGAKPDGKAAKDAKAAAVAAEGKPAAAGGAETKAAKVAAWRKEVADKASKTDPELDAAIKASEANRRAKKAKVAKPKGQRKPGCLDAAVRVLGEAGKPMQCGAIVQAAIEKGYWQTKGATPGATLYAAVLRECAAKGAKARFRRAEVKETKDGKAVSLRGYFELTEVAKGR